MIYRYYTDIELKGLGLRHFGANVLIHNSVNIVGPEKISVGDNVRIDAFVTLSGGAGISLGSYIHIGGYSFLAGGGSIEMGDFSGLSQGTKIYSVSDEYSGEYLTNPTVPSELSMVKRQKVMIGRHVIVGSSSVVLPGVTINDGCAVGALSLVRKSLPEWGIYAGNPLKFVRGRSRKILEHEKLVTGQI